MGHDALQDRLNKNIVGMAEMRTKQAEVMDLVSNHFGTVFLRDNKRCACSRTALLVHPDLCGVLLSRWTFSPAVAEDEKKCTIRLDEVGALGTGADRAEALERLAEDILNQTRAYFSEMDLHARLPETRSRYPWFLRILQCRSIEELMLTIGMETFVRNPVASGPDAGTGTGTATGGDPAHLDAAHGRME